MNQKKLESTIRTTLIEMLKGQGVNLPIMMAFQPDKQGRLKDGIYFFPISHGKRGWQARKYIPNGDGVTDVESQINETMFQFQAFVKDNPKDDDQLLADDVLKIIRGIFQSISFIGKMQAVGIGIQRPTDIVSPSFINEHDNYEYNPNFTIIFSHTRTISIDMPKVGDLEINTYVID